MTELDLKDFHFHFGKSHFEAFANSINFLAQKSVQCDSILTDIMNMTESFYNEIGDGQIRYFFKSEEKGLFSDFKNKSN